jgi:hypothetical protein
MSKVIKTLTLEDLDIVNAILAEGHDVEIKVHGDSTVIRAIRVETKKKIK